MTRGLIFEIPNEYGNFLEEILSPFDMTLYDWYVGGEESYFVNDNQLVEPLFPNEEFGLDGAILKRTIENMKQYLIFVNIKAYPKGKIVEDISTFDEFLKSDCQLVLLVVDSAYVTIYCKDKIQIDALYKNAVNKGYEKVEYVTDDNDFRTRLSVW
ncbi:DUF2691 family protein [Paenibacillus sp. NEAU-GSW1]|uniref:DUF2691 family protein n=1 Tax=Paenibacillus sp. NEAU-GSW1 TaxID=2682486 RepID=UPI00139D4CC6|nr:DUF2691 family protein [Paenibacillus sp. NEAU-GSW1]